MLFYPFPLVCLTLVCGSSVLWVSVLCLPFISLQRFVWYRLSKTRRWPNAGLMLGHHSRRWATIGPVLGYCVVLVGYCVGAQMNVRQRHRLRANINPALVQSIVPVLYRQHAGTGRMKYWLGQNGYWPAPAMLAHYFIDIGPMSVCNRGQH